MDLIAGTTASILELLDGAFSPTPAGLPDFEFQPFTTFQIQDGLQNIVSLYLYRVDVDSSRRHVDLPSPARGGQRYALGLELRYLLTVWSHDALTQQRVLERCLWTLDRNAILKGVQLASEFTWPPGASIKVTPEPFSNEDLLRLWDSFAPPYNLSLTYCARTVLLEPIDREAPSLAQSVTNVWTPQAEA